ncbi:Lrp/AsnC family transcriptional regulator, partial [Rhizobium ruizarguesonis]
MPALDSIDRNILRLLRLDARMSNSKLAAEIGLSPSACLMRIKIRRDPRRRLFQGHPPADRR